MREGEHLHILKPKVLLDSLCFPRKMGGLLRELFCKQMYEFIYTYIYRYITAVVIRIETQIKHTDILGPSINYASTQVEARITSRRCASTQYSTPIPERF